MKFTVNNIDYEAIEKNGALTGYYYKTENGKKTRISRAIFEAAEAEHIEMGAAEIAEQEETFVETTEVYKDEPILAKGVTVERDWDGDTTIYMVMRGGECVSCHWTLEDAYEAAVKLGPVEPEKPEKSTKKRTRKSKDIAHESNGVTLTAKQVDFMKHLPDTCFWENGLDSEVWVDCLCDDIGGQFENKPMTVGAMISTLCEKGIGVRGISKVNGHKATAFKLTEIGKVKTAALGIE